MVELLIWQEQELVRRRRGATPADTDVSDNAAASASATGRGKTA